MELSRWIDGSTPSSNSSGKEEKDKEQGKQTKEPATKANTKAEINRNQQYLQKRRTNHVYNRKRYIEYDVFFF